MQIAFNRRQFIISATAAVLGSGNASDVAAQDTACSVRARSRPAPKDLRKGDLLWPKPACAYVPFSGNNNGREDDVIQWHRERDAFIAQLMANAPLSSEDFSLVDRLSQMRFDDFELQYVANLPAGLYVPLDRNAVFGVGHVAIVDVDAEGNRWVIEANKEIGAVVVKPYADWEAGRGNDAIWHGRVSGLPASVTNDVAKIARGFEGRRYWFFGFNLDDDSSFYCSKLVWICYWRGAGLALDESKELNRRWWVSPKQIMESCLVKIQEPSPGPYLSLVGTQRSCPTRN